MDTSRLRGHGAMLLANVSWGLMSPIAKTVMAGGIITPLVLTDLRVAGAMVLFWLTSLLTGQERVSHRDHLRLLGASLLAIVFNQGCFLFGVSLSSPADASIITTSMPLWAMVLAAVFLKEPITGRKVLGIALGAGGALLLIVGSSRVPMATGEGVRHIVGDALVLTAQFSYACYLVLYKNFVRRYSLVTVMKWMFTYAFIFMIPFSYRSLVSVTWTSLTTLAVWSILFVVVIATFVSYMFIVVGQKNLRPTVAGMYNYIQPIVACIVTVLLGMDRFNLTKGIAVVMVFSGVWLVNTSKSRRDLKRCPESR